MFLCYVISAIGVWSPGTLNGKTTGRLVCQAPGYVLLYTVMTSYCHFSEEVENGIPQRNGSCERKY